MIGKIQSLNCVRVQNSLNFSGAKPLGAKYIQSEDNNFVSLPLGNIYGAKINFTARKKKLNQAKNLTPLQSLYANATKNSKIKTDNWTLEHLV